MGDLYWGDNLEVLRKHITSESVDLIYLDPPFNSNRDYNVLFRENGHRDSEAQIQAFTDTWHWTDEAEATYQELIGGNRVPQRVSDLIVAMRSFVGANDMMAYLVMMTIRLLELHRVLKPTGSIYLHCDPTASHYLKMALDATFGPQHFLSEVIWRRTGTHSSAKRWGPVHDVILCYAKSPGHHTWNRPYVPLSEEHRSRHYHLADAAGRTYTHGELTAPGTRNGRSGVPWRGFDVTAIGRHWFTTVERLDELDQEGRIYFPPDGGWPRLIRYEEESKGRAIGDVWEDIPPINMKARERLGYPTQKPEALLERIINASSNPGDIVLDPFCGCGTAVAVAERLHREWVGIDITHLAISLIVSRVIRAFPDIEITRHGEPRDEGGARELAQLNRYDFQNWALTLVTARPAAEEAPGKSKKGADRGIDGIITFLGKTERTPARCIVQVKSGGVQVGDVRDLGHVVTRENAEMGLLITLDSPTGPMRAEAAQAGRYRSELMNRDYPKIQILTIRELLDGKEPARPPLINPYRLAEFRGRQVKQPGLFDRAEESS